MGVCFSCRRTKAARFKDKSSKICEHIASTVSPLHASATVDGSSSNNRQQVEFSLGVGQVNGLSPAVTQNHTSSTITSSTSSMANTISNMKMTNTIKGLVSKQRKRYTADGFNLDLTYISENLIAMGFPAEKMEGIYRNHIDDVVKFLESKHKDHYKIYNLCSERSYDCSKFHKRVATYAFDDHNPPQMELIQPFCADVHTWLTSDERNVAAVHCKAGKGRTGTMVCCYMLHRKQFPSAAEALNHYGQMRTHDKKGVTIPSQRRYVEYYATLVQESLLYSKATLYIKDVHLEPLPNFTSGQGLIQFSIWQSNIRLYTSPLYEVRKDTQCLKISLDQCIPLSGDVKLEFVNKPKMMRKEKLFHFWFNTFFVRDVVPEAAANGDGGSVGSSETQRACSFDEQARVAGGGGGGQCQASRRPRSASQPNMNTESQSLILTLKKSELDDAHKDKQHKMYSADFHVSLIMQRVPSPPDGSRIWYPQHNTISVPSTQDTPSESSEAENSEDDTNEEDGWDSGESTYL